MRYLNILNEFGDERITTSLFYETSWVNEIVSNLVFGGEMAVLPDAQRLQIWRGLSRWWSNLREVIPLSKADLKAAVNATDVWVDNNAASYNSSLPVAARNGLTSPQKTLLLVAVVLMRQDSASLKNIFGDVD